MSPVCRPSLPCVGSTSGEGCLRGARWGASRRRAAAVAVVAVVAVVAGSTLSGCAVGEQAEAPVVPASADGSVDAQLVAGRTVWVGSCARCHGSAGGGGAGPQLNGRSVLERFPTAASMESVVRSGRGGMPAFGDRLDRAEIEAVVAYTRTLLASP
ncbi:MAG: cytochrome c [Actinobacteria bacterium]|nr:cytochrome c [Actinomycetota bacterium]